MGAVEGWRLLEELHVWEVEAGWEECENEGWEGPMGFFLGDQARGACSSSTHMSLQYVQSRWRCYQLQLNVWLACWRGAVRPVWGSLKGSCAAYTWVAPNLWTRRDRALQLGLYVCVLAHVECAVHCAPVEH